ncbi:MAG TPA: LysM peptidoglycan-binding domain-containing protein [Ohtaekwangia sp.]|nr:LysM peptidoglycan-binding domain-containing protein [Ohtaekwangia sp.]
MITEIILAGVSFFQPQTQQDSLGIETVNGKIFVVHKVSEKETLYGISRRYGATVDEVVQYNPTADSGLEIGQILKIPYTPKTTVRPPAGGLVHVVTAKETMFSISKAYGVTLDEIRQWNNLPDNALSIGQELVIKKRNSILSHDAPAVKTVNDGQQKGLHIVEPKETMYSIARLYNVTVDQLREWNKIEGNELKIGQSLIVGAQQKTSSIAEPRTVPVTPAQQEPVTTPAVTQETAAQTPLPAQTTTKPEPVVSTIYVSESVRNSDEVSESGLAELIEGTESNRKYLALHKSAPVGTILKVRNEMNNREVFVRVTGKLPDSALHDRIVIKISKSAYDRLGAIDPRFRVQITYYK